MVATTERMVDRVHTNTTNWSYTWYSSSERRLKTIRIISLYRRNLLVVFIRVVDSVFILVDAKQQQQQQALLVS